MTKTQNDTNMKNTQDIAVIIPCYNEEKTIGRVIDEILGFSPLITQNLISPPPPRN